MEEKEIGWLSASRDLCHVSAFNLSSSEFKRKSCSGSGWFVLTWVGFESDPGSDILRWRE